MTFGEKLSGLRREANYTQEQLADLLDVSRQSVSKWESDLAYPETDKLVRLGRIFGCSMDYLLDDRITEMERSDTASAEEQVSDGKGADLWDRFRKQFRERKSERLVLGMPLYHIGRNAHGFIAIGLRARGVISVGLMARGIVSLGLLSLGVLSFGLLTLGLISAGVFSVGLLAVGSVALGLFAAGAVSVGLISFGALSVGCFSTGALAIGKYAAVGDHAYGMVAIGQSLAEGSAYSHLGELATADIPAVTEWLDANVPRWLGWAKEIFKFYIR